MLNSLKLKSEFSRNIFILITGTTIAQAIPIAISPILTRIYTPEDFGIFALYMSIASIISVIATGRYELAIMLPKKDDDALNIMALSIMISFFVSFMTLLIVFLFNAQITHLLGNPEISSWLYFIPMTVLLTGTYQSFNYWSNRKKEYRRLATTRIIQSGVAGTTNLGMGFCEFGASGLIFGGVFGQSMATYVLGKIICKEDKIKFKYIKKLKIFALSKRYINFPKFDLIASFVNVFSHQLIHILFNILFTSTIAGFYYFSQKTIGLPSSIVANAIGDVFKQKSSDAFNNTGNAKKIYLSTFKKLFLLALFPSLILYFFVVDLFSFIFGENWSASGEYVKIMMPMLFFRFISSPLSFMLYVSEKQHINMYSQLLFLISIIIGFSMGKDEYEVISYITILFSFIYLYYIYISAKIAKVF